MKAFAERYAYPVWIALVVALALLHAVHLTADFPNHSPWPDWAKYTDEGWYANAAIRAHLRGHWYEPGGFNPAVAVPLWPSLLWLLFGLTGVSLVAARGLAVALFLLNLLLVYGLVCRRAPRWAALLAVTLLAGSPFLYAFSRLALLEPLLMTLALLALRLALDLSTARRFLAKAALVGLLFAAMVLAKTTAVMLLPALLWALAFPLRHQPARLLRALAAAVVTAVAILGLWAAALVHLHLLRDLTYFFFINSYPKPHNFTAHLLSLWWAVDRCLWVDPFLMPLFGLLFLAALVFCRRRWASALWREPLFVASLLSVAGFLLFMAVQNHAQPRYYVVVAFFAFPALVQLSVALAQEPGIPRLSGELALVCIMIFAALNGVRMLRYVLHPQYTWITAARSLTAYIDSHPNGRRLLLSISGDEITLMTGLPAICDDFGTALPARRIRSAHPGWYAAWNDLDPAMLAAIHPYFALDQVAIFPALDDPERNRLVLFRLVPLNPSPYTPRNYEIRSQITFGDHVSVPVE